MDLGTTFKSDLLSGLDKTEWPDRIDYVASCITDGEYIIGPQTSNPKFLSTGYDLERAARDFYLEGIAALTDDRSRATALPDGFRFGDLLVEFIRLREGLENVDRRDVPPGEVLSRIIVRTAQRQTSGDEAHLARQLRADVETPRELIAELTTTPEIATMVDSALPESVDPATLTTELASLDLTTELWDHQLESLALWLYHGRNAYVDMATATGKTVLGLAAVAHAVDSGSLHPADQQQLEDIFDGEPPTPHRNRPNNVLIVTTDDLLGVQWARLFQDHCHTPPSFTKVEENGIRLPWGQIDIRSASGMNTVDPSDYRLAIFDEVHNYSGRTGWGDHLVEFVESSCPVLALTGSVTKQLETLAKRADRPFPLVYRYTHEFALADGIIPDFEWTLIFTDVTESDALAQFRETAIQFEQFVDYEGGKYRLHADMLSEVAPDLVANEVSEMAGEYVSGSALAKGLREPGDDGTAPIETLESLASGMTNRTIHRLNLSADLDPVVDIAEEVLLEGRPVLILTRSYREAEQIEEMLEDGSDDHFVKRLQSDQSASEQDEMIQSFDAAEIDEKVLIGPGKRIGQGNDIQTVEVGINITRPGSGVNATLVQRLGRLLRDAGDKDTVKFYHVIGVPPADATIEPDGESFVRTVAEFFGQVIEPDTDGILKPPSVSIEDGVEPAVGRLEKQGVSSIRCDDQATIIESAYADMIDERDESDSPAVTTGWFSNAFGDSLHSKVDGFTSADDNEPDETERRSDVTETSDDDLGIDLDGESGVRDEDVRSPLAEHYDAFRSLGIMHKALQKSSPSEIPESDPLAKWIQDVHSILVTGYDDQEVGYGEQQANRSQISMSEYRKEYGNRDRVTEFEFVSVISPSKAITALLDDTLSGLSSWVVPVTPETDVPLPVVVESEAGLERARGLLAEFPADPDVFPDDSGTGTTVEGEPSPDAHEMTETGKKRGAGGLGEEDPKDLEYKSVSATPVEETRGVTDPIAEALREECYTDINDLRKATDQELAAIDGVPEERVQLIRAAIGSGD